MNRFLIPVQSFLILAALVLTSSAFATGGQLGPANEDGHYRYLIEFDQPGLLAVQNRQSGERFDPEAPEVAAHRDVLIAEQAEFVDTITQLLGRVPQVTHHYLVTHSGLAVWMAPDEAQQVLNVPGVVSAERERIETVDTYRGPTFIGADRIWDGSAVPDGNGTRGEGAVVAVLDTGVDPDHPSFANDASCGHGQSGLPDKLISLVDCSTTDSDGRCNGPLPMDTQSHGSHVAGTAAGNRLDENADPPPEPFDEISGVAPCAHIRSYKVCPDISCPGSLIQAGMNTVLLDGDVDVMNFSISGGRNPWNDNDRRKLDLVDAGVVVAASAGNTGPTTPDPVGAVNHLGPWVFTIAASTHDGGDVAVPHLSAAGPGVPPADTQNLVLTQASADPEDPPAGEPFTGKSIRRAIDDPLHIDDEGCIPFTPGYFDGAAALIKRGTCSFALKVQNAQAAGAEMVVIRNNVAGALTAFTVGATPQIPVYGMSGADGEALAGFIGQHPDQATANFEFISGTGTGDVLAGFSLRGPTPAPLQHLQKPDITAPGVNIFAPEPTLFGLSAGYGFKSGTSMSSPHAAGAATLVRAVHPDWTAPEVKSALMMTAFEGGTKPDETTPWDADDVGSGRADLGFTTLAGLVMHETFANYLAANPAEGGDVRTLNVPAVRDMNCTPSCSWKRTVRNTLDVDSDWTATGISDGVVIEASPSNFSFSGDTSETRELTITATPIGDQTAAVAFGKVVLSEVNGRSPDLHVTVAVRGDESGTDPGDPPVVGEIDDADPAIEYRRGWHRIENGNASNGGYHRRMGRGAGGQSVTARLVFEGDSITYFFATSEQGGSADVFINGVQAATVDYAGTAPGDAPEFGHSITFDDLGEGQHEILIEHDAGAVYIDGFEIRSHDDGGADASAAQTRTVTSTATGQVGGVESLLMEKTVDVTAEDEWLSVVIEGDTDQVSVELLDPLGAAIGEGAALLGGSAGPVGFDIEPALEGPYTVQVLGSLDSTANVAISIARTQSVN